ncbi:MarR family winged helix-turn-helix transcriptional regulator [Heliobacterium mobile]|uniref:MarR family winged helix-turn-helix transcriptional regulator n=1 Tax=Heliobacterium mobile TaxID=28064 RepID=UPI0012D832D0|nr:MarR family transcriptional regulator [Heliobacterium mobile]
MAGDKEDFVYHFYLRNIVHNLKLILDEHLIPHGITNQQARIVGHIGDCEEKGCSICQKDIELAMGLKGSSITSLLQGLEKNGFVKRSTSVSDGRAKVLSLTTKGEDLIDEFNDVFRDMEHRIVLGMTAEQKRLFLELLQLVSKNLER